ncbi:hypothetical protein N752_20325 [Desulforamulus aquiferis]|nr:hypothetical protein N752_20325 [Desulforamulus aquiferis]
MDEPTVEDTIAILKGIRDKYEAHHRVSITDEAIESAAKLSDRYITDRFLPDKAIDLIDEAASRVRIKAHTAPPDLKDREMLLEQIKQEKEAAINNQEFEKAAELRDREQQIIVELNDAREAWNHTKGGDGLEVTEDDIAHIVASWTGIPVKKLAQEETEKLLNLEEVLHRRVVGQDDAVKSVSRAVRRARLDLKIRNVLWDHLSSWGQLE